MYKRPEGGKDCTISFSGKILVPISYQGMPYTIGGCPAIVIDLAGDAKRGDSCGASDGGIMNKFVGIPQPLTLFIKTGQVHL